MKIKYSNVFKVYKTLFVILIVLFMITSFSAQTIGLKIESNKDKNDIHSYDRYIVQFNDEPVSVFKNRFVNNIKNTFSQSSTSFINSMISQKVSQHKNKILLIHSRAKEEIMRLTDTDSDTIFSHDFSNLFNGIVIKNIPDSVVERIKNLPYVKNIVPDRKIRVCLDESVPMIRADEVWELTDGFGRNITGEGISIAIIDTGVDYNHPDLKDNYVGGFDFVNNDDDPLDDNGHGTHCAGIALGTGNHSGGVYVGAAPDAELYAYKVLDDEGEGYESWFIQGVEKAQDPNDDGNTSDHINIISISAGNPSGHPDDPISISVDNAVESGIVVVAAAGNNGDGGYGTVNSPGCARKSICVGAIYKNNMMFSRSSRGPTSIGTLKPDVVAPGCYIVSALASGTNFGYDEISGYYTHADGTSMACPHVAGVAALLLQGQPGWSPDEIKMAIRNTADDIGYDHRTQGYGRVDAYDAVILPDAPPVAILNTSGNISRGLVKINGTAICNDFQSYQLYYQNDGSWEEIFESTIEVNDSLLFTWNTSLVNGGTFKLKLVVESLTQSSEDIVFVTLEPGENEKPDDEFTVDEGKYFTYNITDDGSLVSGLAIFMVPCHLPQIKFVQQDDSVVFKAPKIVRLLVESLEGQIIVFKILGEFGIERTNITVVNTKIL